MAHKRHNFLRQFVTLVSLKVPSGRRYNYREGGRGALTADESGACLPFPALRTVHSCQATAAHQKKLCRAFPFKLERQVRPTRPSLSLHRSKALRRSHMLQQEEERERERETRILQLLIAGAMEKGWTGEREWKEGSTLHSYQVCLTSLQTIVTRYAKKKTHNTRHRRGFPTRQQS